MGDVFARGELAGVVALVVDDDPDILDALADLLRMCDVEVATARSGNEAFAVFSRQPPEVVISDVNMPNGSGIDLIRQIRSLPPDRGGLTPAIAFSAASSVQECFEAGFHYYYSKPVEPLVLLDTLRDFVRAARAGRAKWTVTAQGNREVLIRFDGHVTAADMRAAVSRLLELLSQAATRQRVIVDLRRLTGFDPSVGAVAQRVAWRSRHHIAGAVIVGGSVLSHLVARSTCLILGFPCQIVSGSAEPAVA